MAGRFECFTDKAGEYRFRLKAGNGENILASEGYTSKAGCENGEEKSPQIAFLPLEIGHKKSRSLSGTAF